MKKRAFIFVLLAIAMTGSLFTQVPQGDIWKNKILYIGGSFGLGPIMGSGGTVLGGNLSPLQINWQMTKYLSLGTGLNFYFGPQTKYTVLNQTGPNSEILETYSGMETHIIFPLVLEGTFRPDHFSIEFGGGLYVAPVVMNTTVERTNDYGSTTPEAYPKKLFSADSNNPFGFIATSSFGFKVGQGILFLNFRYLRDFSEITVKLKDEKIDSYHWNIIGFNIGYKYGFFTR